MDIFLKSEKNKTNQAETDSFSLKKSESCFDINCKHHNTQKNTRSLEFIRDLNPSFESQAKMSKSLPNKNSLKKIHSFEEMNHESSIHKILFHSTKTNRKFKESNHNLQSLINDNRSSILAQNEHSSSDNNSSKIIIPQEEEKKNESSINSNLSHSSKERQKSEDSFTLEKNESNENLSFNKINAKRIETLKEMSEKNADDKNEKTKNLNMFLYDFEAIKNYSKYFQNGNCKNILTKLIKSKKIMMGKNFKRKSRINEL